MAKNQSTKQAKAAPATEAKPRPAARQPLDEKSEAQLKREIQARARHLGPGATVEIFNKQVNGFTDFLREQSVVGLAIGLVLGTQVKQVVDQLIQSFIDPLIGLFLPGTGTLAEHTFQVHLGHKAATFGWGAFAATLLSFVFVAAVVYYVFKGLKLDKLTKQKDK